MDLLKRHILKIEIIFGVMLLMMFILHILILTGDSNVVDLSVVTALWQSLYKPQLSLMFLVFTAGATYGWLGPVVNLLIYLFLISIPITGLYLRHEKRIYIALHLMLGLLIFLHLFGFLSAYGWALGN